MNDGLGTAGLPGAEGSTTVLPSVVDRTTWQSQLDALLIREKAHTRAGDALAAARRRLPMVEVDPAIPVYSAQDSADALLAGRWFGMQVCYLRHGNQVFETYWTSGRGAEAMAPSYALLDMTVYGMQETWEDSPPGWPQPFATDGDQFRSDGRPAAQWSRLAAGRSDDLGTGQHDQ